MDRDAIVVTPQPEKPVSNDHLDPQWERNLFYFDGFRKMVWVVNIQVVIILALVFFLAYIVETKHPIDRYFAETAEGRHMQMVGLSYPNMGKMALMNWVSEAATQIMTFGFNDVDQSFAVSRQNFTDDGWESFHSAMVESGLVATVIKAQQVVTSAPKGPPIILSEGLINGKYTWTFELPMLITFRAGGVQRSESKNVRIVLEQVPTSENPNAVGIAEWYIY